MLTMKWPSPEMSLSSHEPMPFAISSSDQQISISSEPLSTPAPIHSMPSELLTLYALLLSAQDCPRLRELGLFINATASSIFSSSPNKVLPSFRSLEEFQVGLSQITEPGPVVLFLSQICLLQCTICAGLSPPTRLSTLLSLDSSSRARRKR